MGDTFDSVGMKGVTLQFFSFASIVALWTGTAKALSRATTGSRARGRAP